MPGVRNEWNNGSISISQHALPCYFRVDKAICFRVVAWCAQIRKKSKQALLPSKLLQTMPVESRDQGRRSADERNDKICLHAYSKDLHYNGRNTPMDGWDEEEESSVVDCYQLMSFVVIYYHAMSNVSRLISTRAGTSTRYCMAYRYCTRTYRRLPVQVLPT